MRRARQFAIFFVLTVAAAAAERYVFDVLGVEQGLSNLIVTALVQDREGYLWVGTENGLFRYDGAHFRRFSTADGLPADSITGLKEGPDGSLWAGTIHGIAWRTGLRFRASADETLHDISFTQGVAFDGAGHIYLTTKKGWARAALPGSGDLRLEPLPAAPGVASPRVTSIWVEPGGAVWFGCATSICRLENGTTQVWGASAGVPEDGWQFVTKDAEGNLWARSRVYLIELPAAASQFRVVSAADVAPLYFAFPSLAFDGAGTLLVPTNTGLSMSTRGGWRRVGQRQGLPVSTVTAALRDRQGSLWVGSTAGLARWTGYPGWQSFTETEGLASGGNLALIEDAAGGLWAGSGGGLSHGTLQDGSWSWKAVDDRSLSWVANVARSRDGAIWLSTVDPQVARLDPRTGKVQRFGHFDGPLYSIFIDSANDLWAVRTNALYRVLAGAPAAGFEQIKPPGTTPKTVFTRLTEDSGGNLWVGTFSGLYRLAGGQWTHLDTHGGLASDRVIRVTPASSGGVWVTYRSEPFIDRVWAEGDRLRVEHVNRARGMADDLVYAVGEDRGGRLWALTDRGAALRQNDVWAHFNQSDGLLWNDCNTFFAASDGAIWIGTERGLTRMPPGVEPESAARPVTFSEVWLEEHDFLPAPGLTAPHPGLFAAWFSGLDLVHGRDVQYRYRTFGLNNRWMETNRAEVHIDHLGAGRYRLQVQSRRKGAEWGGVPASLAFAVRPLWFESGWFQGLVIACIGCTLWMAWKARVRHFALARTRLQRQVDARTRELTAANTQLRGEMAERERAAQEKQRLEEELLQARKLEAIGRLAGGVAHDFNNLLTVINGHCELLLDRLNEFDPVRASIQEVRGAGERAAELTRRLLAFSRKQMLQPKPVSLADTVRGVETMLRRLVRADIDLFQDLSPDSGMVMADRGQMEQVLINLVVNARDAIGGAGRISIGVRNTHIAQGTRVADPDLVPGDYVTLSVADSGRGMDEETLRNIFEPFFTTKDVGKGTGLGLAMVHGVVKQSGGSVVVESRPEKGSTFHIYLPRVPNGPAAEMPATAEPVQHVRGHESILLVEDQEQVRELGVALLRHAGYSVDSAADGVSALMLIEKRETPLDLLLTDLVMPLMSGRELAREVRQRSPRTRVLYISGYGADALVDAGALHLSKPFTPNQLLEQVRKALDTTPQPEPRP